MRTSGGAQRGGQTENEKLQVNILQEKIEKRFVCKKTKIKLFWLVFNGYIFVRILTI